MTEETPETETTPPVSDPSSFSHTERCAERTGELVEALHEQFGHLHRAQLVNIRDERDGTMVPVYLTPSGQVHPIPQDWIDERRDAPLWREGNATMTTLDSFIELTQRFKNEEQSVLFARDAMDSPRLTAVIDYHPAGAVASDTGRRRHKITYNLPFSDEWKAWMEQNGKWMDMATFAAFLEERIIDVEASPSPKSEAAQRFLATTGGTMATPSKLIELSRNLEVHEGSQVVNKQNLSTGEAQFTFETKHTDAVGAPISVPKAFVITIPVFQGALELDQLIVRLRYRLSQGKVVFGYEVWRADLVFKQAFQDACDRAVEETNLSLYTGTPEV